MISTMGQRSEVNQHFRQLRTHDVRNQRLAEDNSSLRNWANILRLQGYHSQGSVQGSSLLSLPAELRLEAYRHLLNSRNRAYEQNDKIDVARFTSFESASEHERISNNTYGWIFTHPVIFREALSLVIATHPLVFYDLDTIRCCRHIIQPARNIILDIERASPNAIRQALHRLKHLPKLERLEFRVSPYNIRHVRISPDMGGFPFLAEAVLIDPKLLCEEQRHDNQYTLEKQPYEEKIRLLDAEIIARDRGTSHHNEAENFSTAVGDYAQLHRWSTVELSLTKHDIQLKLLWQGLKNSPAPYSGSTERRNLLYCQRALLEKDLWMRKETTEKTSTESRLYEEWCSECNQRHW